MQIKSDHFGKYITRTRNKFNENQFDFSFRVDATQPTISRWETGRKLPDPDQIVGVVDKTGQVYLLEAYCQQCPVRAAKRKRVGGRLSKDAKKIISVKAA